MMPPSTLVQTRPAGQRGAAAPERLRVDARTTVPADRFVALAASAHPRLSWQVPLIRDGQEQTAFEAVVRDAATSQDVWASGIIESGDPWVRIAERLAPHREHSFAVRARDERGDWSEWAQPVPLETGPHTLEDWGGARWVAAPPLSVVRRSFPVDVTPRRARLHLTGQGLVRASVNGTAVNAAASDPSRTDPVRALYRSYDVTDLVLAGDNVLDLALARGEWERTTLDPRVLAVLVIAHSDGTHTFHGTGPGMLVGRGPVTIEEPFYLEAHEPGHPIVFDEASVTVLDAAERPGTIAEPPAWVSPDPGPPVRVVETLTPVPLASADPGVRLFDVGVNVAGRSRLILEDPLPAGTVVDVVHGEHVGADGRLDTTNLTMPFDGGRVRQAVRYSIGDGAQARPGDVLEPWFCYHGFRYLEVTGLPTGVRARVEVKTLHSDIESNGTLTTDAPEVDTLLARARRTLLNNVHGIPEDCPTREQAGWTGDTASAADFTFSAFDVQAFFTKWLGDLRTSQEPNGAIPAISPDVRSERIPADPVWGAALQRVLEGHWLAYGDLDVVRDTLPALRRWVDFLLSCAGDDGTIGGAPISYGHDWLALEQTPPELHHTAATLDALRVLGEFEEIIGATDAAAARRRQSEALRDAARAGFVDSEAPRLSVGNGSQGSLAVAIEGGWLTDAEVSAAVDRLERDIRARGNRVSSGFATTRSLVRALADQGQSQVIFDALRQPAEPGIGAMIDHGPGTFWECWWIDPDNTGTGSLDHIGLGGPFAGWAWHSLAGVRPIGGGYSRFVVEPRLIHGLTTVSLETRTVRGTIALRLHRDGSRFTLDLTVPVGSEAVVRIPGVPERIARAGHHRYAGVGRTPPPNPIDAQAPWHPPSWAPLSTDVEGDALLLQAAIADNTFAAAGSTASITVIEDGLRCMPVPHAQLEGPILRVVGTSPGTPGGPLARVRPPIPLDLSRARFAFAMFDLCLDGSAHPLETTLRVICADGSVREKNQRLWPAGWMRTTLDVADWAPSSAVVAIEAGLRYLEPEDNEDDPRPPIAFHLGRIGFSRTQQTWP